MTHESQINMELVYNNLYSVLIQIYMNNSMSQLDRHEQIPSLLAVLAIRLNDMDKVTEICSKFGISAFTSVIGPWGQWVLQQMNILEPITSPDSPTNIQYIENKNITI